MNTIKTLQISYFGYVGPTTAVQYVNKNTEWKFLYIYDTDNQEQFRKMRLYRPSGRNWTCGTTILVQCSNQLSYRETVVKL